MVIFPCTLQYITIAVIIVFVSKQVILTTVLFSGWQCPHTEYNLEQNSRILPVLPDDDGLPDDVNSYPFSKYVNIYFKVSDHFSRSL